MKWVLVILFSAFMGGAVFGLGLIGYFAYGEETAWYLPLNIVAGISAFLFALYENIRAERDWKNPPRARGY